MKFTETRKFAHILMVILVIDWGFEYICAKHAMESLSPLSLIFFKYSIGVFLVAAIKFRIDRKSLFRLKDVPVLAACAISGDILYYFSEYKAMDYMPISLITIMLALVPIGSIIIERLFFHKHVTVKMLAGMGVCVIGVAMVIGADFSVLFKGRVLGYLLCFGAITAWNVFNFLTAKLTRTYSGITLTMNQLLCTILLTLPYGVTHLPSAEQMTPGVIGGLLYLGLVSAGFGFYIYVYALRILGPTTNAVYSNFLPLTATFFGWLFFGEMISPLQIVGGLIVITTGYIVIKEKGRLEEKSND
ncbi:MAG: DMT family transporter [Anaerovoracaceae bacterium]